MEMHGRRLPHIERRLVEGVVLGVGGRGPGHVEALVGPVAAEHELKVPAIPGKDAILLLAAIPPHTDISPILRGSAQVCEWKWGLGGCRMWLKRICSPLRVM
jgi:hypothetical protein